MLSVLNILAHLILSGAQIPFVTDTTVCLESNSPDHKRSSSPTRGLSDTFPCLCLLPHLQSCCLILACASFFLPSFISSSMLSFHILEEKGIQSFYWASYCVSPFFPRQICLACHQTSSQCLFTPGGEIRIPGLLLKRQTPSRHAGIPLFAYPPPATHTHTVSSRLNPAFFLKTGSSYLCNFSPGFQRLPWGQKHSSLDTSYNWPEVRLTLSNSHCFLG